MNLKLMHLSGKTYFLNMRLDATIYQTKVALVYLNKLEYQILEFVLNSRVLQDNELISSIGYSENDTIIFYEPISRTELESIPKNFGFVSFHQTISNSHLMQNKNSVQLNEFPTEWESDIDYQNTIKALNEPFILADPSSSTYQAFDSLKKHKYEIKNAPSNFEITYQKAIAKITEPIYPQDKVLELIQNAVNSEFANKKKIDNMPNSDEKADLSDIEIERSNGIKSRAQIQAQLSAKYPNLKQYQKYNHFNKKEKVKKLVIQEKEPFLFNKYASIFAEKINPYPNLNVQPPAPPIFLTHPQPIDIQNVSAKRQNSHFLNQINDITHQNEET
ncbi:hypothetical protein TRFO_32935 [Tritrichomonas foetus]|uniref:Ubiquitin-like domain-containing protein n=1 Tax=Tritrichomonas foetus TaxID=1144522 RepID=A0A1J4JT04_9EUKA|nr:hypothetical protein TRFO_32935 [Tritrichomonas foetus]|eukprot:OHT00397.1 hypothetical protein TRFO_32935 [Tritrichomonas foetus]